MGFTYASAFDGVADLAPVRQAQLLHNRGSEDKLGSACPGLIQGDRFNQLRAVQAPAIKGKRHFDSVPIRLLQSVMCLILFCKWVEYQYVLAKWQKLFKFAWLT